MNRTIKFRGKRKDNGSWIYGMPTCDLKYIFADGQMDSPDNYEVDPSTVGQFTGLTDKDGREIWEGDVVQFTATIDVCNGNGVATQDFLVPVFWSNFRASWSLQMSDEFNDDLYNYVRNGATASVVSNIHDNPELIS